MGLMDELRRLARPYEDEDEEYDEELEEEYDEEEEEEDEPAPRRTSRRETRSSRDSRPTRESRESRDSRESARTYGRETRDTRESARSYSYDAPARRPADKVVNINTTTQLQVVLVKPEKFENASDIADHLRDKRTVVLNLEKTQKDVARRLLDFLSGVAYAQEGKIKKVALQTYIVTPYNVDIMGDLIDELENNGLYF